MAGMEDRAVQRSVDPATQSMLRIAEKLGTVSYTHLRAHET